MRSEKYTGQSKNGSRERSVCTPQLLSSPQCAQDTQLCAATWEDWGRSAEGPFLTWGLDLWLPIDKDFSTSRNEGKLELIKKWFYHRFIHDCYLVGVVLRKRTMHIQDVEVGVPKEALQCHRNSQVHNFDVFELPMFKGFLGNFFSFLSCFVFCHC